MGNCVHKPASRKAVLAITMKKETRKVKDSFIVRFLKLQEKISTLNNVLLLVGTIQQLFCKSREKRFHCRQVLVASSSAENLFSALPVFDGDWESVRLIPVKKTKVRLTNDTQKEDDIV